MKTALAYLVAVVGGPLCLTLGVFVIGHPVSLALSSVRLRVRVSIAGVLAGAGGVVVAVLLARAAFHALIGPHSFGWAPFLVTLGALLLAAFRDLAKLGKMTVAAEELPAAARGVVSPAGDALGAAIVGYMLGVAGCVSWYSLSARAS